jgi:t-SNARE complex subunit (syntaxin)
MATFTEAKTALDEIAERSTRNKQRVDQAKALLSQVQTDLSTMATAYTAIIADIDAAAVANPTNAAWETAKAEKDQLVADFLALQTEVDALVTAVS